MAAVQDKIQRTKINTIFSDGTIRINPNIPIALKVNSAFSIADMPNNATISFGNYIRIKTVPTGCPPATPAPAVFLFLPNSMHIVQGLIELARGSKP